MKRSELIAYLQSIPLDGDIVLKVIEGDRVNFFSVGWIENAYYNQSWHYKQRVVLVLQRSIPVL